MQQLRPQHKVDWHTAQGMPDLLAAYVTMSKRYAMLKRIGAPREDLIQTLWLMNSRYGKFADSAHLLSSDTDGIAL